MDKNLIKQSCGGTCQLEEIKIHIYRGHVGPEDKLVMAATEGRNLLMLAEMRGCLFHFKKKEKRHLYILE